MCVCVCVFSGQVMSDCLEFYGLWHAMPPCPSPSPRVWPSSCPLNWWCHPTISSSVIPVSYCLQSFLTSGSFPGCRLFSSVSILPMTLQGWFPLGLTCLISLLPKGLWGDFLALCLEGINYLALSLLYRQNFTSLNDYWKHYSLDYTDLCQQSNVFVL